MAIAGLVGGLVAAALTLPLAWKWQLGMRRVALGLLAIVVLAGAIIVAIGAAVTLSTAARAILGAALTLLGAFGFLAYRFYRDPERTPPSLDDVIVSPADGTVVYVRHAKDGRIPVSTKHGRDVALEELTRTAVHGDSIIVGIGMSFLDVHVNRAPIAGRVELRRHFPGRFGSLRIPEMVFENERATTLIAAGDLQVAVVQIASRLVRQIAGFVREGESVVIGQRIGVIRLGSQVDLVLPNRPDLTVHVAAGDQVEAGTSVIASLRQDVNR